MRVLSYDCKDCYLKSVNSILPSLAEPHINSAWAVSNLERCLSLQAGFLHRATLHVHLSYTPYTDKLPWFLFFVYQFTSVQSLSHVRLFATAWIAAHKASLSITNSQSSLKLMSIESVMPSSHLILCHLLFLLPPISPSIRVFSNESTLCMRWRKYWSFSFSIIPSKEHPGLISFRMDWLDLLAVQRTLKSLLQHHSSKASILRRSAFFTVHLSHPYMTNGKTIALTRQTLVGKVMSLLLNMLSRLVITFLPRSKRLLISWLQSPSAVILEPKRYAKDFDCVDHCGKFWKRWKYQTTWPASWETYM